MDCVPHSADAGSGVERAPHSVDAPLSAGPPSSGPTPAELVAWGRVRDAITSIHNLETLLRSPRIGGRVLGEVLPEFLASVTALREAFGTSALTSMADRTTFARDALCKFTYARLDELELAMRTTSSSELDARGRLALEQVVTRVSVDLDAAADLLDLSERAEHATPTELSLDELVRVSLRGLSRVDRTASRAEAPSNRKSADRETGVRLARSGAGDCAVRADPHVMKRLIAFAVARVNGGAGARGVTIRVTGDADHARFEIGPSTREEEALATAPMRLTPRIAPTDVIVDAAAAAAGITSATRGSEGTTETTVTMRVSRMH